MENNRSVLLAGGGTAGHVNPLLAAARCLRDQGWDVTIIGTREGKETELVPAAGFDLHYIPRIPLPRRPSLQFFTIPSRMRATVKKIESLIQKKKVGVVIGFGGYVSTPAYLAARRAQVPLVIQEQNARPGLANRLGARWAKVVALTFSSTKLNAKQGRTTTIGLPLRPEIAELARKRQNPQEKQLQRAAALKSFELDQQLPTLLVTGGSLGALSLNQALQEAAAQLPENIQVIHLTGKGKDKPVRQALPESLKPRYRVLDYLVDMERALAAADLVVCRSGAGTVAEMTALALPAVYVPLPIGNGEQRLNAEDAVTSGGALLVDNAKFNADFVTRQVVPLLLSPERLQQMSRALPEEGIDAAEKLAQIAEEVCR
ncbi:undecaprenyldiphospho-muramoylpentapeptide beta-N-acetylglucosaminyltransferase [Varibaculum cambriense]|uniref:undecaprenyldiphospho-muramoylpentapeptide beta-N-acetylglucosaminyltransferase n=1 Tax=Varibaculum cambriense TaxID=184870 RepID=UPI0029122FC5|nr:undecaprenyldiphospho-muramoylpentapeptide beta-N-acetylglucosaminyltransferase [Varibaculum cambriense]MDU3274605.1 undecaprenyldiphospho-muramoylpentapeptide beta-N-acetylglucosaminyltransferase [Varibaculum cambriense]